MRKHRLAERLLDDVIGLDWDQLHIEACRWEHVMSDEVERRIVALLKPPMTCPHGNPIPGLDELTAVGFGDAGVARRRRPTARRRRRPSTAPTGIRAVEVDDVVRVDGWGRRLGRRSSGSASNSSPMTS